MKLTIVIPCFNESEVIHSTYSKMDSVLSSLGNDYELIFVNDGSTDNTLDQLKSFAIVNNKIKIISFSRNFGHQPAVTAGINECSGDYALIIDADLQDPPELLPEMIKQMQEEKANVIYGVRKIRKGESLFKKVTAKLFYKLIDYLSDVKLPLDTGDFRLIDKKVINEFNKLPESHKYIRGLISWIGFKQRPFFYVREERLAGETHYPFFKMVSFALKGLLYFSNKPLRLASNLGFLCTFFGALLLSYILISYFFFKSTLVTGWASILTTVVFFGGVQLLTIGILGEYLGNIFDEVKRRPNYIIEEKINF